MPWLFVAAFVVILGLDVWSKYLVVQNMAYDEIILLPLNIIQLRYIHNHGAAFGMMQNKTWFLVLTAVLVLVCMALLMREFYANGKVCVICGGMVAGGALGNLIDRLRWGYVVDFLDLRWWPIFNVADIGITVGTTLLVLIFLIRSWKKGPGDAQGQAGDETEPAGQK